MKLSIIIPLYNEEDLIIELLNRLLKVNFPDFVTFTEIIIVDDCSKDNSYNVIKEFIKPYPQISLYKHEKNMGKGAGMRTGISKAQGDVILFQDADLELSPEDIPSMVNAMNDLGVEFINGSRYLPGITRPLSSYKRYVANKIFSFLTSLLADVKITDMACGYKLISKSLLDQIVLTKNQFGIEAEIILKSLKIKRNNVAEIPVRYFPRNEGEGKKFKSSDALKILWTILQTGILGPFKKSRTSAFAIFIILFSVLWSDFNECPWESPGKVIAWDVISYYAYLPATIIHNDLTLKFIEKNPKLYVMKFWPDTTADGHKYIKTSMGLSFLYLPFFFLGHITAYAAGLDTDGFSPPYKFWLVMSSLFYLFMGLFFLRKVLLRYFSENITALTLIAIVFGTNLFYYATFDCTECHCYNFSLISILIYVTMKWYEKPGLWYSLAIGGLIGLISLIRPTNSIIVLLFILWSINSYSDITKKVKLFLKHYSLIIVIVLLVFLIWLPQLIYWKYITGQWLFFSYGRERFFFNHPQIINGLFSYRKGWLLYTPIMIFALIGIPFMLKKSKELFMPVLLYVILNTYIILSWWTWWYGGSYGQRTFIDSYGLMAFGLAAFIQWVVLQRKVIKRIVLSVLIILIMHGIFQTAQFHYGAIHYDSMSKAAYWNSFGRIHPSGRYWSLLESPDYHKALQGIQAIKK